MRAISISMCASKLRWSAGVAGSLERLAEKLRGVRRRQARGVRLDDGVIGGRGAEGLEVAAAVLEGGDER
jgi:hypothetical protein